MEGCSHSLQDWLKFAFPKHLYRNSAFFKTWKIIDGEELEEGSHEGRFLLPSALCTELEKVCALENGNKLKLQVGGEPKVEATLDVESGQSGATYLVAPKLVTAIESMYTRAHRKVLVEDRDRLGFAPAAAHADGPCEQPCMQVVHVQDRCGTCAKITSSTNQDAHEANSPAKPQGKRYNTTIICDRCELSYHLRCVGLTTVPKSDWFCPTCSSTKTAPQAPAEPQRRAPSHKPRPTQSASHSPVNKTASANVTPTTDSAQKAGKRRTPAATQAAQVPSSKRPRLHSGGHATASTPHSQQTKADEAAPALQTTSPGAFFLDLPAQESKPSVILLNVVPSSQPSTQPPPQQISATQHKGSLLANLPTKRIEATQPAVQPVLPPNTATATTDSVCTPKAQPASIPPPPPLQLLSGHLIPVMQLNKEKQPSATSSCPASKPTHDLPIQLQLLPLPPTSTSAKGGIAPAPTFQLVYTQPAQLPCLLPPPQPPPVVLACPASSSRHDGLLPHLLPPKRFTTGHKNAPPPVSMKAKGSFAVLHRTLAVSRHQAAANRQRVAAKLARKRGGSRAPIRVHSALPAQDADAAAHVQSRAVTVSVPLPDKAEVTSATAPSGSVAHAPATDKTTTAARTSAGTHPTLNAVAGGPASTSSALGGAISTTVATHAADLLLQAAAQLLKAGAKHSQPPPVSAPESKLQLAASTTHTGGLTIVSVAGSELHATGSSSQPPTAPVTLGHLIPVTELAPSSLPITLPVSTAAPAVVSKVQQAKESSTSTQLEAREPQPATVVVPQSQQQGPQSSAVTNQAEQLQPLNECAQPALTDPATRLDSGGPLLLLPVPVQLLPSTQDVLQRQLLDAEAREAELQAQVSSLRGQLAATVEQWQQYADELQEEVRTHKRRADEAEKKAAAATARQVEAERDKVTLQAHLRTSQTQLAETQKQLEAARPGVQQ